jgi:SAM-dependent methyltransferase
MNVKKFKYDQKRGGIFAPEFELVPYPAPIMRRQAIFDITKSLSICKNKYNKYIEIGYGAGIFAYEFYRMGFDVYGYDFSDSAYSIVDELFNTDKLRINLIKDITQIDKGSFSILGAYEVLEHIKDDMGALLEWKELLSDGGILLISVPAHMKKFGLRDRRVGHIRRYDKNVLLETLAASGFEVLKIFSYGFPLPRLIEKVTEVLIDKKHIKRVEKMDMEYKSSISGIARNEEFRYKRILPYKLLVFFSRLQRLFYCANLGIGYIVAAKLK